MKSKAALFVVTLSTSAAFAPSASAEPLSAETTFPSNGDERVPKNARLFAGSADVSAFSIDGAPLQEAVFGQNDPHPGFDGVLLSGLDANATHVLEVFGATDDDTATVRFTVVDEEDTTPPIFESDIDIEQRWTVGGYDLVAIVPFTADEFSVARIGVFSTASGAETAVLFDSRTGQQADDSWELRVNGVPAGEEREVQVIVVDAAGNEAASEVFRVVAGEGGGCSASDNHGAMSAMSGLAFIFAAGVRLRRRTSPRR